MPRIRTIKPEFWSDEKLARMPMLDRLVFIALWSMADDLGRVVNSPKQIDAFMFPYSENDNSRDIREALARLSRGNRVSVGNTESGQSIIQVENWSKHQKVDRPNVRAALPEIVEKTYSENDNSRDIREALARESREDRVEFATRPTTVGSRSLHSPPPTDQRPTTNDQESVAQKQKVEPKANSRAAPPTVDAVREYCLKRENGLDPEHIHDHYTANGWKQANGNAIKDWKACVRTWEKRKGDFSGNGSSKPKSEIDIFAKLRGNSDE